MASTNRAHSHVHCQWGPSHVHCHCALAPSTEQNMAETTLARIGASQKLPCPSSFAVPFPLPCPSTHGLVRQALVRQPPFGKPPFRHVLVHTRPLTLSAPASASIDPSQPFPPLALNKSCLHAFPSLSIEQILPACGAPLPSAQSRRACDAPLGLCRPIDLSQ